MKMLSLELETEKKDKVKNSKCQLNIIWFDDIQNRIKCCKFEKNINI